MECRERTSGEHRAHLAAIGKIVARWQSGEISMADKRELIASENAFYHGKRTHGRTGMLLTGDTAEVEHVPSADDERRERGETEGDVWWRQ